MVNISRRKINIVRNSVNYFMDLSDFQWFVGSLGIIGVFIFTFTVSLLPFVSPSNALEAMLIAMSFPSMSKLGIGLGVAVGATAAKTVHFTASYGLGRIVEKYRGKKERIGRYGMLTMYIMNIVAAATPIPDEWVVIPMGLSRVNVVWFVITYFIGKMIITVPSAYLGHALSSIFIGAFGENKLIFTVLVGIAITAIFMFIDVEKTTLKILRKLGIIHEEP